MENFEIAKQSKLIQSKEVILSKLTLDLNNNVLIDDKQATGGNLVFNTLLDLETYASSSVDSVGQVCGVANTTDNTVKIYKVNIDKTVTEIGTPSSFEVVPSLPSSPDNKIYILSTNYSLNYYDGSAWHTLGSNQIVIGAINTDTTKLWLDTTSTPILKWHNGTDWINISGGSSTGGHIIQDATTTFTQRKNIKFTGDGITITDDSANDTTLIDIVGGSSALPNVKNLGMTIADGATQALISFKNPTSAMVISKIHLFVSYLEDLSNQPYTYCLANTTLLSNSFTVTNGSNNTFNLTIDDTNKNKNAYVRVFTEYSDSEFSSGLSINQKLADITPTTPVTNISVTQLSGSSVRVNWTNPTNTDLKSVNVVQKYDNALSSIYDGSLVYTGTGNSCTIIGIDNTKHIYLRLYTLDMFDNIQNSDSQVIDFVMDTTPTSPIDITKVSKSEGYGYIKIKWEETNLEADWKKTIVRISEGAPITSIEQGNELIVNATRDYYKTNWLTKSGLVNGTKYYINFATVDNFDNISSITYIDATPVASALNEVSNLQVTNIENGTKLHLFWTNPMSMASATFNGRVIFFSKTEDLEGKTYDYCSTNATVIGITTGVGTGSGIIETFDLTSTTVGEHYNFRAFARYDISGTNYYSSGSSISNFIVKDETPLTDVTGLVTTAGDTQNTISWYNSNTALDVDFSKVQIFRKIGNYPDGTNDLEKVYESTNQNVGVLNTFTDTGLANNVLYYYLIKLVDTSGNININSKFTLTPVPLPILSVSYEPSTDTWERLGINTNKTSEDLWSLYPYNNIKRILFDGTTTQFLKADDSTKLENGSSADLTINMYSRIPKFYYKYSYADGKHTWSIAETQLSGFTLFPAFVRSSANKDYVDIGCFKGSVDGTNKLESKNGKTPNVDKAFSDYRTYAKNIGTNYNQFDAFSQSMIDLLFIIQYVTGNIQTVFAGVDDLIKTNGQTLSLGNRNGVVNGTLSLYGVEGLFSNGSYNVIDGLKATSTGYYLADDNFASMTSESVLGNYTKVGSIVPTTTSGFIEDIEQVGSLFLGKDNTGSSSNGFADMQYSVNESGLNVLCIGGVTGEQNGLFQNNFVNVSNLSKTLTMTNEGNVDIYTIWRASLDKTNLNTAFKSIGSFTLVDGENPSITVNQVISAKLNGRLIKY